jgi:hypothetical protein
MALVPALGCGLALLPLAAVLYAESFAGEDLLPFAPKDLLFKLLGA